MADDLGADLHQPVAQRRQRPMADRLGQGQRAQEVGEVVGQGVKLEPHRVGGESVTGQARPGDRVLTLLDALLRRAALVVEHRDPLNRAGHVGDDEADTRIKFAGVPFDLALVHEEIVGCVSPLDCPLSGSGR